MYHKFFIHSSVDGHLGCFHVLAIVNSVAMNNGIHVSLSISLSSGYRPRSGTAGSQAGQARRIWWDLPEELVTAGDQPQLIQGIRSGDGVGEDQETTA